ncbi:MAG: ATP-binding protein [Pseudomonadota bacterium]|nr:ATP-binding protein [Pseudomonadota bacterium]
MGLDLDVFVDSDVPAFVNGDPGRLRQILLNLVGNAIKFTERGGISVSVQLDHRDEIGLMLGFEVADTGIGIPESARDGLIQQLSGWGMQTEAVAGIEDAQNHLKDADSSGNAFGLVFINHSLNEESGVSLGTAIRREYGRDRPKLVFITADESTHVGDLVTGAGFDSCLSKPLRLLPLMDRLSE